MQKVCKKLCRKYAKNSIHTRSRHKSQDTHKGRIKGKQTKQGALLKQSFFKCRKYAKNNVESMQKKFYLFQNLSQEIYNNSKRAKILTKEEFKIRKQNKELY